MDVDFKDAEALKRASEGASRIVSALNGLEPVVIGAQGQLLDAAIAAGVPKIHLTRWSMGLSARCNYQAFRSGQKSIPTAIPSS